mmetsp:Transcript_12356/g.37197  ORF Transcript_12356/g.37197 Transcript_12356/m.37197 type:complete len:214 (+) Transcript_12356:2599-3240(+)
MVPRSWQQSALPTRSAVSSSAFFRSCRAASFSPRAERAWPRRFQLSLYRGSICTASVKSATAAERLRSRARAVPLDTYAPTLGCPPGNLPSAMTASNSVSASSSFPTLMSSTPSLIACCGSRPARSSNCDPSFWLPFTRPFAVVVPFVVGLDALRSVAEAAMGWPVERASRVAAAGEVGTDAAGAAGTAAGTDATPASGFLSRACASMMRAMS